MLVWLINNVYNCQYNAKQPFRLYHNTFCSSWILWRWLLTLRLYMGVTRVRNSLWNYNSQSVRRDESVRTQRRPEIVLWRRLLTRHLYIKVSRVPNSLWSYNSQSVCRNKSVRTQRRSELLAASIITTRFRRIVIILYVCKSTENI